MKHYTPVNVKSDQQMVDAGLRPPVLNIDRSCFRNENKNPKGKLTPLGFLREEMLDIIVRSQPRFNVVLKLNN